jgi:hypothetical protein
MATRENKANVFKNAKMSEFNSRGFRICKVLKKFEKSEMVQIPTLVGRAK